MFLLDFYVRFVTLFGTGVPIGGFFQLNRLDIKRLVEKLKLADKPGSVKFVRKQTATIIHLGQQSLTGSSNTPDLNVGHAIRDPIWSCSGWSLPCRILLPATRCALTAPFHPYQLRRVLAGGLLSAALVVGLRRPGVTWHPTLWSPDFPPVDNFHTNRRLLGQLTGAF